ncbi:MAG TPA: amidase [Kofleriaceae bacterium]|nr:amidase [Kofleriaceae bacterium]
MLIATAILGCAGSPRTVAEPACAFDVVEASIGDLQQSIRQHRTTCHAIVAAYLDRIATLDASLNLHAITVVNKEALVRADEIDRAIAHGDELGPLVCAPILVKDNYNTIGLPTTAGSIALQDHIAQTDAFMVAALKRAGAIVLAKTNMAEWAFYPWATHSSSYGTTANAYAPDRTPAGSSGGTAVGVAESFGVAGLGSDTGNSIRGPSSHAALFGLRSTLGLASRSGVVPLFSDRDVTGPMTRTVEDGAKMFDVISAFDPTDPLAVLGADHHTTRYATSLDRRGLVGKRIGVVRELVPATTDPEILRLFEQALKDLVANGAVVVDPFAIDNFAKHADEDTVCASFRFDVNTYLRAEGTSVSFTDVATVFTRRQYAPDVKDSLNELVQPLDRAPETWVPACQRYPNNPLRQAFLRDIVSAMDGANVDLLVFPTWTAVPAPLARAREDYAGDNSQLIAPSTGMPAATVPMGFSHDIYPAGLQLVARPFAEATIFAAAYAYEQATHHRRPPPNVHRCRSTMLAP